MKVKLTTEMVMDLIQRAKIENLAGSLCVPQVDQRIRDIVNEVDSENREPTKDELMEIIHIMGFKEE